MKKAFSILIVMLAALVCHSASAAKVYYVVAGSFSSLEQAHNSNIEGEIFKSTANGKMVYRICPASFYNASDAKEYARAMKSQLNINAWVCPNDGVLKHVNCIGHECICAPLKGIPSTATVYYIVAGSYNSLEMAKAYNANCPDGMEGSIMIAQKDGKTVYRACIGAYLNKAKAQEDIKQFRNLYGRDYWLWTNKGPAKCALYGTNLVGTLIYLNASSTK